MIVAINKIDKHEANAQRIRERLLSEEVVVEEMGGDVQDVRGLRAQEDRARYADREDSAAGPNCSNSRPTPIVPPKAR